MKLFAHVDRFLFFAFANVDVFQEFVSDQFERIFRPSLHQPPTNQYIEHINGKNRF